MNEAPKETGIQDSQTFDAYADTQPQLSLFTQFFTDTFGFCGWTSMTSSWTG